MPGRLTSLLAGGVTAAVAVGLTGTPAHALTWTITPAGNVVGGNVAPNGYDGSKDVVLVNKRNGAVIWRCPNASFSGNVPTPTSGFVRMPSVVFGGCAFGIGAPISMTVTGSATPTNPWVLSPTETVYTPPQIDVKIDAVGFNLACPGCTATVGGPLVPNQPLGTITGHYDNTTRRLVLTGGGNLTVRSVSGCFGYLLAGDGVAFYGSYLLSPGLTITSP
ncbi:hypothetical protein [Thermomonospora umbrina]|uniref:Uncharacterized protein n=1 Tax=Thermomonospora umbrina TaxID=111806 RepID=A0A3D9SI27_9ACTN|nr:hypothetical protein [Thermomonospora umbrina]REE95552.1 hypothetical protein DFJ69_0942 [Thermomonospora umbrina]